MIALSSLKLANNTFALILVTAGSSIIRLVTNLILARLLFPEAFAVVGIVASTMFVMELLTDLAFDTYIIRHKEGNKSEFLNTLWTIRLIRGFILTAIMAALSWKISEFLEYPEIQPVILVSSLLLLLSSLESFSFAVSTRSGNVAKPLYIDLFSYFVSTIFTITFAYFLRTYWALIYGMYISSVLKLSLSYLLFENPIRKLQVRKYFLPEFFSFAKIILPSSFIYILLMQGDKVIIAKTLSASQLGLYYVAFNFSSAALQLVTAYSSRVLFPVCAEAYREMPLNLAAIFYKKKSFFLWFLCFLFGILMGGAHPFFDTLYDDRYLEAAKFLSILLIHPILCTISNPAESCLIAAEQTKVALIDNILRLSWVVVAAFAGFKLFGSIGVVWAFSTIEVLPIVYLLLYLLRMKLLILHKESVNIFCALSGYFIATSVIDLL